MVRHTLKILQQMLQDVENVSDHVGACINGLKLIEDKFGSAIETSMYKSRSRRFMKISKNA